MKNWEWKLGLLLAFLSILGILVSFALSMYTYMLGSLITLGVGIWMYQKYRRKK